MDDRQAAFSPTHTQCLGIRQPRNAVKMALTSHRMHNIYINKDKSGKDTLKHNKEGTPNRTSLQVFDVHGFFIIFFHLKRRARANKNKLIIALSSSNTDLDQPTGKRKEKQFSRGNNTGHKPSTLISKIPNPFTARHIQSRPYKKYRRLHIRQHG